MFEQIDIGMLLMQYFCLLLALCVHEAAHAAMANYCGDPTARLLGRLTLNPVKHADPLGTVILPLVMFLMPGIPFLFGWAKPVPFNPANLKDRRLDPVWIALAGPGSNIVIGTIAVLLLRVVTLLFTGEVLGEQLFVVFAQVLVYLAGINFVLAMFNVIPVPPLDGHYVLKYFLPPNAEAMLERIGPFGILIAIIVARPWLSFAMQPFYVLIYEYALGGVLS